MFCFLVLSLSLLVNAHSSLPACSNTNRADYDYVVVGAGAGGGPVAARLAEKGYSVLVVEAGHDPKDDVNTTIPLYFGRAVNDVALSLDYSLDEYPPGFRFQNNDVWYPRARGLGGSTLHNDLINLIAGTTNDFNNLASMTKDRTWMRDNMQTYFERLEKNLDLPPHTPDHGFDGWLKTSPNPNPVVFLPNFHDDELTALQAAIDSSGPVIPDLNSRAGNSAVGIAMSSYTIDEHHNRSSVRERLLAVHNSSHGKLTFRFDTLATKILLCNAAGRPTAFGVQIASGFALPVAGNFHGKPKLTSANTQDITVRREVIVSAGTFQSPQLLMLSGIGNSSHLRHFGITPVVDLPGVGTNLQDHDEIGVMWRMKVDFTPYIGCTFLSDPKKDPCLQTWITSNHSNGYSFGPALRLQLARSKRLPETAEPDIMTYHTISAFHGFVPGFAEELAARKNIFSSVALKAHPSSRGTVRLTGSHPQDKLDIQKLHFQNKEGPQDVADLREAIKGAREIMARPEIASYVEEEVFPGSWAETDAEIDQHVYENVFGHHACCTNPIGPDHDPNAVLDGNFRVRGVAKLRVVDASSWPTVPGYFVTTPIYMISEKAADVIIADAKCS